VVAFFDASSEYISMNALTLLLESGYHGLNMDRIATKLGLSKGTVYNHFSCKEEIVIALAIETTANRSEMFSRAAGFDGNARFRMQAIGVAAEDFVRQSPEHFMFEQILRLDGVWAKTSLQRRTVIRDCETKCMGIVAAIVRDAISQGDLELPAAVSPEELVFGLWSLTTGAYNIVTTDSLHTLGMKTPYETVRVHTAVLLDGYMWKPLSSEYDRDQLIQRINQEVFGNE